MANKCDVTILREVSLPRRGGWVLCLQWCVYVHADEDNEYGYRFIWRRPNGGKLQAARGQARLPSIALIKRLIEMAEDAGWGMEQAYDADWF